jgi:hypothetical protein
MMLSAERVNILKRKWVKINKIQGHRFVKTAMYFKYEEYKELC